MLHLRLCFVKLFGQTGDRYDWKGFQETAEQVLSVRHAMETKDAQGSRGSDSALAAAAAAMTIG